MTMLCDWCQFCWVNGFRMTSKCLAKYKKSKRYYEKCQHFLPNFDTQNDVYKEKDYKSFAKFYGKDVADYVLSKVK